MGKRKGKNICVWSCDTTGSFCCSHFKRKTSFTSSELPLKEGDRAEGIIPGDRPCMSLPDGGRSSQDPLSSRRLWPSGPFLHGWSITHMRAANTQWVPAGRPAHAGYQDVDKQGLGLRSRRGQRPTDNYIQNELRGFMILSVTTPPPSVHFHLV